jgi:hypothetical protein
MYWSHCYSARFKLGGADRHPKVLSVGRDGGELIL